MKRNFIYKEKPKSHKETETVRYDSWKNLSNFNR